MKRSLLTLLLAGLILTGVESKAALFFLFKPKYDSIQLVFDAKQLVLPGESFKIGVIAYKPNGKVKKTTGLAGGNNLWLNYKVEVTGGSFSGGKIKVDETMIPSIGKWVHIKVYPRKSPQLLKELDIPLNYETRISFRPVNNFPKVPGSEIKGELLCEFNNGVTRTCTDLRNSDESKKFKFTPYGGSWAKGRFTINPDIRNIMGHTVSLITQSLRNPAIQDVFNLQLDYRSDYKLPFTGFSGNSGFDGSDGISGGTGYHGGDGQRGQNGMYGSDGPDIGVWADLYYDSVLNTKLLYVFVQNLMDGKEYRYLVNPDGGSITVTSRGGDGGYGGDGGDGGNGGKGNDGEYRTIKQKEKRQVTEMQKRKVIKKEKKTITNSEGKPQEIEVDVEVEEEVPVTKEIEVEVEVQVQGPGQNGGDGGYGGPGGLGAPGGYGGNITLYFTDDALPYRDLIRAESIGGSGGKHGDGGRAGQGGPGGYGNPSGQHGKEGYRGPYVMGWAESGGRGQIFIKKTEEFFNY